MAEQRPDPGGGDRSVRAYARWNDDRLDDLAHNVERLVPLVEQSARTSERLAALHNDMQRQREDLRDDRQTMRLEVSKLGTAIDDLYERLDEETVSALKGPADRRRSLVQGISAAVVGAIVAGFFTLLANGILH